jgi:large subunit ribosomal protein L32
MALPRGKRTKSSKKQREFHLNLKPVEVTVCPKCKKPASPHRACAFCGTYAGKAIIPVKVKKGDKKKAVKETAAKEKKA